jgi:hypothetical protein
LNRCKFGHRCRLFIALTLCILLITPVLARDDAKERAIIVYVQSTPASKIESGLPDISFEKWLSSILGGSQLEWKVYGCGEEDDEECTYHQVSFRTPQWHCPSVEATLVVEKNSEEDATPGSKIYLPSSNEIVVSDFGISRSAPILSDLEKTVKEVAATAAPNRPPSLPAQSLKKMTKQDLIEYVQALNVHRLDPSLPSERFDNWLLRMSRWPLQWWQTDSLNDSYARCGPKRLVVRATPAGMHDLERRMPPFDIFVDIGSWERGIEGEPVLTIYFKGPSDSVASSTPVKNLPALQKKFDEWSIALSMRKPIAPVVQDMISVGRFDQVRATPSGHCYGHSLDLWKQGERLFGLHHRHEGLCGDPPCSAIQELQFDPKTGDLEFLSSLPGHKYKFAGRIEQDKIVGVFDTEPVSLKRRREYPLSQDSERNVAAWCAFWTQISRCNGVKELCDSMGVPETREVQ